jgi:hypothetical protein
MHRSLRLIALVGLLATLLAVQAIGIRRCRGTAPYSGAIEGAPYRVEVSERWNGTLVLYSHGYMPPAFPSFGIALTDRPPDRSEIEACCWSTDTRSRRRSSPRTERATRWPTPCTPRWRCWTGSTSTSGTRATPWPAGSRWAPRSRY